MNIQDHSRSSNVGISNKLKMESLEKQHADECICCKSLDLGGQMVFGEGDYQAGIFIVGEAPGESESKNGKPFVGAAGRMLNSILNEVGIDRNNCYITNVLKKRPPNNREPFLSEIETCGKFLIQQISIIRPKFIITLGRISTKFILGNEYSISQQHGKFGYWVNLNSCSNLQIPVMPTFHPSYALWRKSDNIRNHITSDISLVSKLFKQS